MHSETDKLKRDEYMFPFLKYIKTLNDILTSETNIGAVFNSNWVHGDKKISPLIDFKKLLGDTSVLGNNVKWFNNHLYVTELIDYFGLSKTESLFNEGNFYIVHKDVANDIFGDKLLYNILNDSTSFDYQWVYAKYKLHTDFFSVYKQYCDQQWDGNHLCTPNIHKGLSDNMIEHVFERIIMNYVKNKLDKPIIVVTPINLFTYSSSV